MTKAINQPAPLETRPGKQRDDNIDDLGRHADGSVEDQPVDAKPADKATAGDKRRPAR